MPAYGKNLNPAETTALVVFLETLHPSGQGSGPGCVPYSRSATMTALLVAFAALYVRGWYCLGRALPQVVPAWRLAAFAGGIAAVWIAVASPAAHLDHHLLTAHMVQHLLLMVLAAPLILLGAPATVLMHGLPRHLVRSAVTRLRHLGGLQRLGITCTHPAFCWLAGSVNVIVWHVPAVFEQAIHSQYWHEFEHASFFVAGILFWWPVIQPWPSIVNSPRWSIPVYLFLAALPCDALSAFLAFCGHVVYQPYLSGGGHFRLSPLEDQALAGALMWVTVTFAYLIPALVVTAQLISGERRRAAEVGVFLMPGTFTSALEIETAVRPSLLAALRAAVPDLWSLTKPEVNFLIVIAAFTGFYLGCPGNLHPFPFARLLNALCGTLLVASGTGTLNQYLEYRFDAQMRRTCRRPIAAGRLRAATAAWFGAARSVTGAAYLVVTVNALASVLAGLTLTSYLFVYTPLKRRTPLCTLVGAFPGAMPPLIGWAAASDTIGGGKAWILCAMLFLWQFPHFMAIAWMYREDYARAGYLTFPTKGEGSFLTWLTLGPSFTLFPASLAAVGANCGGIFQYCATVILGAGLLYYASRLAFLRSKIAARELLKATIIYLPLEFLILVLGKG